MKVSNLLLFSTVLFLLIGCNKLEKTNYKYSKKETEQFLDEITNNLTVSIGDIVELNKQPTNSLYLLSRYPLNEIKLNELNNNGVLTNTNNDISDFATYTYKSYELINNKGEKLQFVDNGRSNNLQEYGLWKYDNVLHQNLGILITLNKTYETLNGHITIEFEMPGKIKRDIKIPVAITINDKLTTN